MNWTRQTEEMMKSWTEAQKRIWDGWAEAARKPATPSGALLAEWISRWQQTAGKAMGNWPLGAGSAPGAVIGRLLSGEEAFLRFIEVALGALKTVAPGIDAGEDWVELLRRYIGQMKEEMAKGLPAWMPRDGAATVMRDVPELWAAYLAELRKLGSPWAQALREAPFHLGELVGGDRQAVVKLYNVFMDNYEATFGRYLSAPAIGFSRETNEKILKGFEAWLDYKRAAVEFQTEVVGTGFKALEKLLRELVETAERGEKITTFRQLFDLWVANAEKVYFDLSSTDSFAKLQGRLINSAMSYKIREREIAEEVLGAMNIPSRSEIDDIHRHVHDLRDTVKALRQEVGSLRKTEARGQESEPLAASPDRRQPPAGKGPETKGKGRKPKVKASKATKAG